MQKIPKIIHYVWLGRNKKNKTIQKCIESWHKHMPEYEYIEWNEDNFDINSNLYVKQAYENKKWAFASDYIRLYALYKHGGIYMDTDLEVLKSLNPFLDNSAFTGFENKDSCATAILGGIPGHPWYKLLLSNYDNIEFVDKDGKLNLTTNVMYITNSTIKHYGVKLNNEYQVLKDNLHVYPNDYFCPIDPATGKKSFSENTFAVNHFNASWMTPMERLRMKAIMGLDDNVVQFISKTKKKIKNILGKTN